MDSQTCPVFALSTEVTVGRNIPDAGIALRNGRREPLLLPCILLRDVLYAWKAKHGSSVLQVFASQKVNGGTRMHVDEVGLIGDLMDVDSQVVQWK